MEELINSIITFKTVMARSSNSQEGEFTEYTRYNDPKIQFNILWYRMCEHLSNLATKASTQGEIDPWSDYISDHMEPLSYHLLTEDEIERLRELDKSFKQRYEDVVRSECYGGRESASERDRIARRVKKQIAVEKLRIISNGVQAVIGEEKEMVDVID